jgi:predicted TIM-barrel fold metal-dependent hydrolase
LELVDAQIHLWTGDQAPPHHWRAPFTIEDALREMDAAGIARVVNCPAIWDPASNDYAVEAARRHPDRFATLGWFKLDADASEDSIDRLLDRPGMLGLRFMLATPDLWRRFEAGELDWLFGVMIPSPGLEQLGSIADSNPGLRLIVDHLAVSPFEKLPGAFAHLDSLVALAAHPNIAVKATAVPSMSNESYPFDDTFAALQTVYDAFGAERTFWGSDYTRMHCSWQECAAIFREALPSLKGGELELVMGRAVRDWIGWR